MDMLCIVVESAFVGFVPGLCTCILRDCVTGDRVFGFNVQWSWIQDQVTWYSEHLGRCFVVAKDCITRCDMSLVNVLCWDPLRVYQHSLPPLVQGKDVWDPGQFVGMLYLQRMRSNAKWKKVRLCSRRFSVWYIFSAVWWISGIVVVFGDNGTVNVGNRSVQTSYNTRKYVCVHTQHSCCST